jgi:Mrp family chromosome partitioning ATPase/capsular polysaccharide biosynthesis protein
MTLPATSRSASANFYHYLKIVRRRLWIILVPLIALPIIAYVLTARQHAVYQGTATVLFSSLNLAESLNGLQTNQSLTQQPDRFATTQANIARALEVAKIAVKDARVHISPQDLLSSSSVAPESNADLLDFNVSNQSPSLAARLATAYARGFTTYSNLLQTEPLQTALNDVTKRLGSLRASKQTRSPLYANLRVRQAQIASLLALQTSDTVLVKAADGAAQVAPRPKRAALIGIGLGILLAIALVFVAEALDNRVRNPALVEEALGVPLITRIPPYTARSGRKSSLPGLSMLGDHGGAQAEAFRSLRTSIAFIGLRRNLRTVVVTSARPGEGKTLTVANLGIAFARSGRDVIIVDLDARKPALGGLFGAGAEPGVTDVVLGELSLEKALRPMSVGGTMLDVKTRVSNYRVRGRQTEPDPAAALPDVAGRFQLLPFGTYRPPDPGAFVSSEALQSLLVELRDLPDLVIIDSPPLLAVGDALELSTEADGVLAVVRATKATRNDLAEMRRLLASSPAPTLGFVLTDSGGAEGYGYGYGSGVSSRLDPIARERFAPADTT